MSMILSKGNLSIHKDKLGLGVFNPNKYATLFANWDASVTTSLVDSGSGLNQILTWTDIYAGIPLSNLFTTDKPSSGTRSLNGLNVVDFSGTKRLRHAIGGSIILAQPNTIVLVLQIDTVATAKNFCDGASSTTRHSIFISGASTAYAYFAGTSQTSAVAVDTSPHVLVGVFNGASSDLYLDGVQIRDQNPGSQVLNGFNLGSRHDGANGMDGLIAQSLIYSDAMSPANVAAISAALATKWIP